MIADAGGLVADSVISNWIYAGKITASQIEAGTISTDKITIESDDGNMRITSRNITMKSGTENLIIDTRNGITYQHKFDSQGRAVEEVLLNRGGHYKSFSHWLSSNVFMRSDCNYLYNVYSNSLGGGNWPAEFNLPIEGLEWAQKNKSVHAFVTPNEMLRFVAPDGGRINDLVDYTCRVNRIDETNDGIIVRITSRKTYVSSIVNNRPVYATGSLAFNVFVMMR